MTHEHDPNPDFVRFLEWQLRTELRRKDRFGGPSPAGRSGAWKLAFLVLLSVLIGAGGVVTAQDLARRSKADLHRRRAELRLRIAERRAATWQDRVKEAETHREAGLLTTWEVDSARDRLRALQLEVKKAARVLEETLLSGLAPSTELTAPLVQGRDFVSEQLRMDLEIAEVRAARAQRLLEVQEDRFRAGLATNTEVESAHAASWEAAHRVEDLGLQLELRAAFLEDQK